LRRGENQNTQGKTGVPAEKILSADKRTNDKLNGHIALSPRIDPEPHWWEASALNTARFLLLGIFYEPLSSEFLTWTTSPWQCTSPSKALDYANNYQPITTKECNIFML